MIKKNKTFFNLVLLILGAVIFIFSLLLDGAFKENISEPQLEIINQEEPTAPTLVDFTEEVENDPPDEEKTAVLMAVGDNLPHLPVVDGAQTESGYDFRPCYQYVKDIIETADFAMADYEAVMVGPPYTGFPTFHGPQELAEAIVDTGFDAIVTVNNHSYDGGLEGIVKTAEACKSLGVPILGTKATVAERTDFVRDLNGIQVGFMAATFETVGSENFKALNGIPLVEAATHLIDSFNPYRQPQFDQDIARLISQADNLRAEGAEFICLTLHWGDEYQMRSNPYQQYMAQKLCNAGIELIIGYHPHTIEEIAVLQSEVSEQETLVYYSLGNFITNMYYSLENTEGRVLDGLIAKITIKKNAAGIKIEKGEYIPTFVAKPVENGRPRHRIIPLARALKSPEQYPCSQAEIQGSDQRIIKVLGESVGNESIPVSRAPAE